MRIYATPADLTAWTGKDAPENAVGLLRHASALVEDATRLDVYSVVTATGIPAHPVTRGAFRDATTAQAAFWAAHDLDPTLGTLGVQSTRVAASKSIKGASVSYDTGDAATTKQARAQALGQLCSEAVLVLQNAGLMSGVIR